MVDGLIYLLNQAGIALANANERIAQLAAENEGLRAAQASEASSSGDVP